MFVGGMAVGNVNLGAGRRRVLARWHLVLFFHLVHSIHKRPMDSKAPFIEVLSLYTRFNIAIAKLTCLLLSALEHHV